MQRPQKLLQRIPEKKSSAKKNDFIKRNFEFIKQSTFSSNCAYANLFHFQRNLFSMCALHYDIEVAAPLQMILVMEMGVARGRDVEIGPTSARKLGLVES